MRELHREKRLSTKPTLKKRGDALLRRSAPGGAGGVTQSVGRRFGPETVGLGTGISRQSGADRDLFHANHAIPYQQRTAIDFGPIFPNAWDSERANLSQQLAVVAGFVSNRWFDLVCRWDVLRPDDSRRTTTKAVVRMRPLPVCGAAWPTRSGVSELCRIAASCI